MRRDRVARGRLFSFEARIAAVIQDRCLLCSRSVRTQSPEPDAALAAGRSVDGRTCRYAEKRAHDHDPRRPHLIPRLRGIFTIHLDSSPPVRCSGNPRGSYAVSRASAPPTCGSGIHTRCWRIVRARRWRIRSSLWPSSTVAGLLTPAVPREEAPQSSWTRLKRGCPRFWPILSPTVNWTAKTGCWADLTAGR
jgi:hypothetical protein